MNSTLLFTRKCIFLIFLLFQLFNEGALSHNGSEARRPAIRLQDIFDPDYDSFQTPGIEGEIADVSIQIEILNIRSVDVTEMSFIADIFMYKTWKDERLKYPANKSLDKVSLNPEWIRHLWTPDVYFYNALEGRVQDTIIPYVFLWLKNDSTVAFGARLSLEFSCDMLLESFPHDTQSCDIIVKSLTHTITEMNLHWSSKNAIRVSDYIILPQFEFRDPVTEPCQEHHLMGTHGQFACLRGVIKLTRRCGYYIINIYIPTILIVFMSMLTFWIPPDAVPGRVTLGVTSLLTIITKQYQASLPSVSYVIALNVWLSVCIGFVFCSLLEYSAVVALLTHQKRMAAEADKGTVLGGKNAKCSCGYLRSAIMSRIENINCYNIDRVCRAVFPIVFGLHCIIYWIRYGN